jgi:hypothetical protein
VIYRIGELQVTVVDPLHEIHTQHLFLVATVELGAWTSTRIPELPHARISSLQSLVWGPSDSMLGISCFARGSKSVHKCTDILLLGYLFVSLATLNCNQGKYVVNCIQDNARLLHMNQMLGVCKVKLRW